MLFNYVAAALSAATLVTAAPAAPLYPTPFHFPLGNGFPAPDPKAIATIERHAGGALPDGALPTKATKAAATTFQLIAVNEIFEVAFFTELLKNVTNELPGYKVDDKAYVTKSLRRIRAQEELHSLGANGILASIKAQTVSPCKYNFPVSDYLSAIALANTFTDIVLSIVPYAQMQFALDGGQEPGLIPLVGSILAQEGEQTGWFRAQQQKPPSAAPFLTGGAAQFAMSAIKEFIVPGSCKFLPDVPSFPPLTVLSTPEAKNMTIKYSIEGTDISASKNAITYSNGQSIPVTVPITGVKTSGGTTTFSAELPFEQGGGFAKGLTYACVTGNPAKGYASVADVAADTTYGPGLMEID